MCRVGLLLVILLSCVLDARAAESAFNRGKAALERADLDTALASFSEAIRERPDDAAAYGYRAIVRSGKGNWDGALADLDTAIRLDPNLESAYVNRSVIHARKGDRRKAVADLTKAIRLNPNVSDYYSERAGHYTSLREYDRAIEDATRAIKINPKDSAAYDQRAVAHIAKDNFPAAVADLKTAIQVNPNDPHPYNALAAFLATGPDSKFRDAKAAIGYATTACELTRWNQPQYLSTLAAAFAASSDFRSAVRYQKMALAVPDGLSGESRKVSQEVLQRYQEGKPFPETVPKSPSKGNK
jgi:tetratricopeptide (TPR) repeat protein